MQTLKENNVGVGSKPAPAYYINRVKTKLVSGEYATEDVACFCGATNGVVVAHRDRYGITHRMVLCLECSIIYANPRMTEESYHKFYNNEYRLIYDGLEFAKQENKDKIFAYRCGLGQGYSFYSFIQHFDIKPKVVFEIGCNMGSWLLPFKEDGADVYGVDYGIENVEYGKTRGINLIAGGIDELIKMGKKADLVILNHVLEHFLDIESELNKIRELLSSDGYLFISVPGLYSTDLLKLFQNAHTYQFYSQSLSYVMNCCGFEEYYMDEMITSIWKMRADKQKKNFKPQKKVCDIYDYFFSKDHRIPEIRTVNKFTHKERKGNINDVLSCGYPDINELIKKHKDSDAVVICGGPTIDEYIDKIRDLKANGNIIVAIERMYPWCLSHGITPDYVVVLDACDDVNKAFDIIDEDTTHLIATQCQLSTAKLLKDAKTYVFSTPQKGIDQHNYWHKNDYSRATVINGGGSISLQSMAIAMALGCKNLHIFGFDCCMNGKTYADGIVGVGSDKHTFDVRIDEDIFKTTTAYLAFAQQFFKLMEMAKQTNMISKVKVYGDSLVNAMSVEDISDERGKYS